MARDPGAASYELTRFVFFRLLGLVYTVAFAIVVLQWRPLLGSNGLLPVAPFLSAVRQAGAVWRLPSLFWLDASDTTFMIAGWLGLVLSLLVLCGVANVPILLTLWALYLSFVHVGQTFYGYGWEILLLETGFLAVFLAPLWRAGPVSQRVPGVPRRDRAAAVAHLPPHARGRPDQAAGRPLLARPHVPALPL